MRKKKGGSGRVARRKGSTNLGKKPRRREGGVNFVKGKGRKCYQNRVPT